MNRAVDFTVPHNTLVLAAADGTVTCVKDDSNVGSKSVILELFNFIAIMHQNDEYTMYDHLGSNSAKARAGQQVRAVQEIASVGMT